MARMGDWRFNKDEEIELDGIGGVNILVKADVHRSGMSVKIQVTSNYLVSTGICFRLVPQTFIFFHPDSRPNLFLHSYLRQIGSPLYL